jgi:hypothetical protein
VARITALIAAVFALAGIVSGILQRGDLALWCIPPFVILGAIANTADQEAKRLANGATPEEASVHLQACEGILGTFLTLVFLALIAIGYLFYLITQL